MWRALLFFFALRRRPVRFFALPQYPAAVVDMSTNHLHRRTLSTISFPIYRATASEAFQRHDSVDIIFIMFEAVVDMSTHHLHHSSVYYFTCDLSGDRLESVAEKRLCRHHLHHVRSGRRHEYTSSSSQLCLLFHLRSIGGPLLRRCADTTLSTSLSS